ncbi:MAG: hypothetical protein JSU95_01275 [Betaproteobacteria bacterium]|nr:MAG: hypothetical protein JSU95_01275 [Betaproteobacteria bacterium]
MIQTSIHPGRVLLWLYLLNASVLLTHEIDSAYWREWQLFGIPGGIQLFLILNLGLVLVVLYGLQALAQGRAAGVVFSWVLVAGGWFAGIIHTYFILSGDEAFRLPMSLLLLAATFILSSLQAVALIHFRRRAT